jgi:hypothetical protein
VSSPKGGFPGPLSPDTSTGRYRRRVMPHSREKTRAHGQILVDFANAKNTDQACFAYFNNIQRFLDFSQIFNEQIIDNFPSMGSFLESINETEKELLELILKEKSEIRSLNHQFEIIGYTLESYDPQNSNLSLSQIHLEGGVFNGEPDVTVTKEGPFVYSLEELEELMDEIEGSLHPDIPQNINDLMKIGQSIYDLKQKISENRFREIEGISKQYKNIIDLHERIRIIQNDYGSILEMIIEDTPLNEISNLAQKFKTIYDTAMMTTTKINAEKDLIEEIPLIDEANYVRNKMNRGWFIELQNEFVYWMVEFFRERHNRKYIKKCPHCGNFFIAGRIDHRIKFCNECSPKSKMSKEARRKYQQEYRRKKRQEKLAVEREARINNIIEIGFSRKEAIEIIEADSKL